MTLRIVTTAALFLAMGLCFPFKIWASDCDPRTIFRNSLKASGISDEHFETLFRNWAAAVTVIKPDGVFEAVRHLRTLGFGINEGYEFRLNPDGISGHFAPESLVPIARCRANCVNAADIRNDLAQELPEFRSPTLRSNYKMARVEVESGEGIYRRDIKNAALEMIDEAEAAGMPLPTILEAPVPYASKVQLYDEMEAFIPPSGIRNLKATTMEKATSGELSEVLIITTKEGTSTQKYAFRPYRDAYSGSSREIARNTISAYQLSTFLKVGSVPRTEFAVVDGQLGAISDFATGVQLKDMLEVRMRTEPRTLSNAQTFEFLTGNYDTHVGNLLFSELSNGQFKKISSFDYGSAFSDLIPDNPEIALAGQLPRKFDRTLIQDLSALTEESLRREAPLLSRRRIQTILERRDLLLKHIQLLERRGLTVYF